MKYSIHAATATEFPTRITARPEPPVSAPGPQSSRSHKPWLAAVGILVAILAIFAVYFVSRHGRAADTAGARAETVAARTEDFVKLLRLAGTTSAVRSRPMLAPTLSGAQLGSMLVTKLTPGGARVKKGQVLVQFDPQAQLKDALDKRAAYQDLEDQLAQKRAAEDAARAKDETELQQAEDDLKKARLEVSKNDLVSRIDAEKNEETLQEADATLKQLRETFKLKRGAAAADIRTVEIQAERAKQTMLYAEGNASKMTLLAPMDGVVVPNMVWKSGTMGELREGDQVRPGVPFMKIVDPSQMQVAVDVNQADFLSLHVGQTARVYLDAYPGLSFPGRLEELTPLAHPGSFSDKIRRFSAVFSIQGNDPRLMPDLSAAVDVELEASKNAVVVPVQSVANEKGKDYVWLRRRAGFEKRAVKTGPSNDLDVVIESGLKSGELIRRAGEGSAGSGGS